MTPTIISMDTETDRISYQNPVPEIMCLQHAIAGESTGTILTPWEHDIEGLEAGWLNDPNTHQVAHNAPFDLSVLAWQYPDLMPLIFKALNEGRIHDTLIREKLLNLTRHGNLKFIERNGATIRLKYAQKDLEVKYLNIDRTDLKEDEDSPRLNYNIYKGVPLDQWQENFISYAVDDAINCGRIYWKQEEERQICIQETGYDPFAVETYRTRFAWALRLIECAGSCLDGERVKEVSEFFTKEYMRSDLRDPLIEAGMLLPPVPPTPYKNGAIDHTEDCRYFDKKVTKKQRLADPCDCPPKMKAGEKEKSPRKPLFQYIWNLARTQPDIFQAWPTDGCVSYLKQEGIYKDCITDGAFSKKLLEASDIEAVLQDNLNKRAQLESYIQDEYGVGKYLKTSFLEYLTEQDKNKYCTAIDEAGDISTEIESLQLAIDASALTCCYEIEEANRSKLEDLYIQKSVLIAEAGHIAEKAKGFKDDHDDCLKRIKDIDAENVKILHLKSLGFISVVPDEVALSTNEEWMTTFAALDPLLSVLEDRNKVKKICTDYLPKMYYTDPETEIAEPAKIIRGSFDPMVTSGRTSSYTSKMYPSRNEQNVDPRVRPCTIPRKGNIIGSTDFNGMELGTLAQKCLDLFGYSEMANKINAGVALHAYLAAQIAYHKDDSFKEACDDADATSKDARYDIFNMTENNKASCEVEFSTFSKMYRSKHSELSADEPVIYDNFFNHYRTLAKPVGLGYPGGLGAPTLVTLAKSQYGLVFSIELAKELKEIWLETYPEMKQYLAWAGKQIDHNHAPEIFEDDDKVTQKRVWYYYDSPRGMHRPKCSFCKIANGAGLQTFSAEGALEALARVQEAVWLAEEGSLLYGVIVINFIHDEILWESPEDDKIGLRARAIEKIMIDAMEELTPDVKAGAESAAMRRWNKYAKPLWDGDVLNVWEPKEKKEKEA